MRAALVLLLAAAAAACTPAGGSPQPPASEKPRTVSASRAPAVGPTVAASAAAASAAPMKTVALRGAVRLDAAWLARAGVAEALPGGGAKVRAGTLIANNGGAVLSSNGGSVVARDGASLISDRGAGIVANQGGRLTSKTKYALRQAAAGLGPIEGLMVAAVSLETGEPLGQPAYTDAAGAWSLEVPEGLAGNVVLIAAVPGTSAEDPVLRDPRLQFAVVTKPDPAAPTAVDEDAALVGLYLRRALVDRCRAMADAEDFAPFEDLLRVGTFFPPATEDALVALLKAYHDDARAAGHAALDADGQLAMAQRATDALLARLDLAPIQVSTRLTPDWGGPDAPALPALTDALRHVREATAAKLAADPAAFAAAPFLADLPDPATGQPFAIRRATDVGAFVVDAYLVRNRLDVWNDVAKVLAFVDAARVPGGEGSERIRLKAASEAVIAAIADAWAADRHGEKAAVRAAIGLR